MRERWTQGKWSKYTPKQNQNLWHCDTTCTSNLTLVTDMTAAPFFFSHARARTNPPIKFWILWVRNWWLEAWRTKNECPDDEQPTCKLLFCFQCFIDLQIDIFHVSYSQCFWISVCSSRKNFEQGYTSWERRRKKKSFNLIFFLSFFICRPICWSDHFFPRLL